MIPAPESCPCCGSPKLSKLGENVTETLEVIPRQWKVIQTVRERFSCRQCEAITQPPAPFHVTPRGFAGAGLLAMILFEKFGQHQPLNRPHSRDLRRRATGWTARSALRGAPPALGLGPAPHSREGLHDSVIDLMVSRISRLPVRTREFSQRLA